MNGKNDILPTFHMKFHSHNTINKPEIYSTELKNRVIVYESKIKEFNEVKRENLRMSNETFKKKISDKILNLLRESKEKIKNLKAHSLDKNLNHDEIELKQYKKIVSTNIKILTSQKLNTKVTNNKILQKIILKTETNKDKKGLIFDDISKVLPNNANIINSRSRTIKNPYKLRHELTQNDEKYTKSLEKLNTDNLISNNTQVKLVKTKKYEIVNENVLSVFSINN